MLNYEGKLGSLDFLTSSQHLEMFFPPSDGVMSQQDYIYTVNFWHLQSMQFCDYYNIICNIILNIIKLRIFVGMNHSYKYPDFNIDIPVQQKKSGLHYIQVVVSSVGWMSGR